MEPAEATEDKQRGERRSQGVGAQGGVGGGGGGGEDYRSGFQWNKVIF